MTIKLTEEESLAFKVIEGVYKSYQNFDPQGIEKVQLEESGGFHFLRNLLVKLAILAWPYQELSSQAHASVHSQQEHHVHFLFQSN